ncbi:cytochrome P450 [Micromonospora sp. FIMYZ51]|uniref:cytochrome P450 n=1 Tax=Micromonospora sp. FIMYZ51 TaxID=3051832 RepID=UPI00311F27DF
MRSTGAPARRSLYNGDKVWVITRHDQAVAVLSDTRFSSDMTRPGFPLYTELLEAARALPTLATMDPPLHTRLRKAVIGEFTMRRMNALRPEIQRIADELIDDMLTRQQPVDMVAAFSGPLVDRVICRLLGFSSSAMQEFVATNFVPPGPRETPIAFAQANLASHMQATHKYFLQVIDELEHEPADNVLSRMIARHVASGEITRDELANLAFVIFAAGQGPTVAMLNIGVAALLERPDQLEIIKTEPERLSGAVEELLRYFSVLDLLVRVAVEDVEIGGTLIRRGDGVIVPNAAANRDEDMYPDPDTLDLHRSARHHLAFGHGIHQCLGANLARVELEVAYSTLFRRLPGLRLTVPAAELGPPQPGPLPEIHQIFVTW